MESYSVTGNFQGFPQSAGAPGRFRLYLGLGAWAVQIGGPLACRSLPLKLHSSLFLSGVFHVNCRETHSKKKTHPVVVFKRILHYLTSILFSGLHPRSQKQAGHIPMDYYWLVRSAAARLGWCHWGWERTGSPGHRRTAPGLPHWGEEWWSWRPRRLKTSCSSSPSLLEKHRQQRRNYSRVLRPNNEKRRLYFPAVRKARVGCRWKRLYRVSPPVNRHINTSRVWSAGLNHQLL